MHTMLFRLFACVVAILAITPVFAQEDARVSNGLWFDGLGAGAHESGGAASIQYTVLNEKILGFNATRNPLVPFSQQARVAQAFRLTPKEETTCTQVSLNAFTFFAYVPDADPSNLDFIKDVNIQIYRGRPDVGQLLYDGTLPGTKSKYRIEEIFFDPPQDIKDLTDQVEFGPTYRVIDSLRNGAGEYTDYQNPIFLVQVELDEVVQLPTTPNPNVFYYIVWNFDVQAIGNSSNQAFVPPASNYPAGVSGPDIPEYLEMGMFYDQDKQRWFDAKDSLQTNLVALGFPVVAVGTYGGKLETSNPFAGARGVDTLYGCPDGQIDLGKTMTPKILTPPGTDRISEFTWTGGTINNGAIDDINAILTVPTTGRYYTVRAKHVSGCVIEDSIYVEIQPLDKRPKINVPPTIRTCGQDDVQLKVSASNGTPAYKFNWEDATGALVFADAPVNSQANTGPQPSDVTYKVFAIDDIGCKSETKDIQVLRGDLEVKFKLEEGNDIDLELCQDDSPVKIAAGPYFSGAFVLPLETGITIYDAGTEVEQIGNGGGAINDNDPQGSTVAINVNSNDIVGDELGFNVVLDRVCISGNGLQAGTISDYTLDIKNPAGVSVRLFSRIGVTDINDPSDLGCSQSTLSDVCFVAGTGNEITCATIQGANDLTAFGGGDISVLNDGTDPKGNWVLTVVDSRAGGGSGNLEGTDVKLYFKQNIVEVSPSDIMENEEGADAAGPDEIAVTLGYAVNGVCQAQKDTIINVYDLPQFQLDLDGEEYIITSLCKDNNSTGASGTTAFIRLGENNMVNGSPFVTLNGHPFLGDDDYPSGYGFTWTDAMDNTEDLFVQNVNGEEVLTYLGEEDPAFVDTSVVRYNPDKSRTLNVEITDSKGCKKDVDIKIPVVEAIQPDLIYCQGGKTPVKGKLGDGQVEDLLTQNGAEDGDFNVNYSWKVPSAFSNPSDDAPRLLSTEFSSTYTLVVEDANPTKNGCIDSITFAVQIKKAPEVFAGDEVFACRGDSIRLGQDPVVLGGSGPLTEFIFKWSPDLPLNGGGQAISDVNDPTGRPFFRTNNLSASVTLTLTVTDTLGCIGTDAVLVTVVNPPIANAGDTTFACVGITTTLGGNNCTTGVGSGPFTYRWEPTTNINNSRICNPEVNPTQNVTYTVTVFDKFGCKGVDSVFVDAITEPILNAGIDKSICVGEQFQLGGVPTGLGIPPFAYSWSPSVALSNSKASNPFANPSQTTDYILTLSDSRGCIGKDTIRLTVNSLPDVNAGGVLDVCLDAKIKLGGEPTVKGGTAPFNYVWEPAASVDNPSNPNPNLIVSKENSVLTLTVIDINNCVGRANATIRINTPPLVSAGDTYLVCIGDSIRLGSTPTAEGGAKPYVYNWLPSDGLSSPFVSNPTVTPFADVVYTVSVKDAKGCIVLATVLVDVNTRPVADAGSEIEICRNQPKSLGGSVIAQGGTPPYNYSWAPSVYLDNSESISPIANLDVDQVFTLVLTDSLGCRDSSTVFAKVLQLPTADAGRDSVLCIGEKARVGGKPSAKGGEGPYSYSWLPVGDVNPSNAPNPEATPISPTSLTLTVTDKNGCTSSSEVFIGTLESPVSSFNVIPDKQFKGRFVFLNQSVNATEFVWDFGDGTTSRLESPSKIFVVNGVYNVCLVATSVDGCVSRICSDVPVTAVGIEDVAFESIVIAPTMISESMTISGLNSDIQAIEVRDLSGRLVQGFQGDVVQASTLRIQTIDYTSGMYIVRVIASNGKSLDIKVVKP